MQTILEIDNVKKKYGKTQVLNGISLKVEEGEIISVLGVLRLRKIHPFKDYCRHPASG